MRRKSERNKTKSSPEKKPEKVTRKSSRRRGKSTTSSSPEKDDDSKASRSPYTEESSKESTAQSTESCLPAKELKPITEEAAEEVPKEENLTSKEDQPEDKPQPEQPNEPETASVWKVARADASPGEIQKLKLCRQRNTSEASDSSSSRKRSSKWQESGEGDGEEADSAEEQLRSSKRSLSGDKQPDDPSSAHPGQDSNQEVSDSKEILPETTPANLSDDKTNVDQLGDDDANEACRSTENDHIEMSPKSSCTNGDDIKEPGSGGEEDDKTTEESGKEKIVREEEEGKEDKVEKSNSSSENEDGRKKVKGSRSSRRRSTRTLRRKPHNKYRDSSDSESADSEEEPVVERKVEEEECREGQGKSEETRRGRNCSRSPGSRLSGSPTNSAHQEPVQAEKNRLRSDSLSEQLEEKAIATQNAGHKPAKVNLKRSFSMRVTEAEEAKKEEPDEKLKEESSDVAKENNTPSNESEAKNMPRKRRWGTVLSNDATPAFCVSTDSLKALVPGAKPLAINEVRLSKDDDEERERHKEREKSHSIADGVGDHKERDEVALHKSDTAKKGGTKNDNYIAPRRKISILKEAHNVKTPSLPAAKPTDVLLIKNLVRPFTLNQIKELLSRTGTIVENGFWMDRIKSKCYVQYSNEDQAFETRQALHGISWPISNPKRLHVEYSTKEDMELTREQSKDEQPVPRKTEPPMASEPWQQEWAREERANAAAKVLTVREWDLGKEDGQFIREKEREKKEVDKKRRQRSRSPAPEPHLPPPARKFKKKEDDPPPAKLLDDLFRKTKAIPCIYWLPLTNEQIVVKEEMRRQHMAEHARRLEEMRRAERNRDGRRRRSPRK